MPIEAHPASARVQRGVWTHIERLTTPHSSVLLLRTPHGHRAIGIRFITLMSIILANPLWTVPAHTPPDRLTFVAFSQTQSGLVRSLAIIDPAQHVQLED